MTRIDALWQAMKDEFCQDFLVAVFKKNIKVYWKPQNAHQK